MGGGARFSAPVQTGPGVHLASYTMGTLSLPEVKRPVRGVDHPPTSSAEFNLLTPNVNYSGRTAPLTSKVVFYIFIQQI